MRLTDLPDQGEFYVIARDKSIHIPGDQRSIETPGHGYPESTENTVDLQVYDFPSLHAEAQRLADSGKKDFRIYRMERIQINLTITV